MKIYSSQETDLQAATNQRDYEIVVYVYHKMSPPSKVLTLFMGLSSASKNFSNLAQTVLWLCRTETFQGKSCRLQYIRNSFSWAVRNPLMLYELLI